MVVLMRLIAAPLRGVRGAMIAVRMALMVMTATVRYPVPGGESQRRGPGEGKRGQTGKCRYLLGPPLPPQPEHEREP
jgi:hypothetical protein